MYSCKRIAMSAVEPIKDIEHIQKMKELLSIGPRDALLFSFGINSGLKISDILALDVKSVKRRKGLEKHKIDKFCSFFYPDLGCVRTRLKTG